MKAKCKSCGSCGMPMEKIEDFAMSDPKSDYCCYCTDTKGKLLSFEELLQANADCYKKSQGLTDQAAMKMAHDLLKSQPAWRHMGV